uniref:Uncharacterized protein n=1 Tax=Aegilops tauschii subsp. strangulata TaxID=200361 RepID=A0A453SSE4_AEGTS
MHGIIMRRFRCFHMDCCFLNYDSERNTLPNSCIHVHSPQGKLTALYETGTRFLEGR